jgi:acyl transferase domain-containing protein/acyl carrier protein
MASKNKEKPTNERALIQENPIAIIGLSSIFPRSENLSEYWNNIFHEIDCITEVPSSRWDVDAYYDPDPSVPDKTYNKHGGFIPDIDFNPMEYGLPPNILEVTDVSQLLALVVAKRAMQDAGYFEANESLLDKTGVILGMVGMSSKLFNPLMSRLQYPIWEKVLKSSGISDNDTQKIIEKMKLAYVGWTENAFPGAIGNVVAGRVANRLNLGGTNCTVDAACGSSLAAIKMAVSELVEGRADMMITGGVDTDNSIVTYLCFSKTPAFSKGDHLRAFDAESDGMLAGEGLGMLVLKRLADAERDGDHIYAVIKGVGTSSDGRYKSIYAPRPSGQAKAVLRAYEEAGFEADTIGLMEAHGTGTKAGDPAEFDGLMESIGKISEEKQTIALGSVKSNIGHTKAAAGAASMIKATLALHHKILPATINVSQPNPKLDIENSPFYLNTETRPWFRKNEDIPRRAGVSSFGFGGTNFHFVIEEYKKDHENAYRMHQVPFSVLLTSSNKVKLLEKCSETLTQLKSDNSKKILHELSMKALTERINSTDARVGFIAKSSEEAQELLMLAIKMLESNNDETWQHPKGIYFRQSGMDYEGKIVVLFPGQGSQYVNMGRELAINFPEIRNAFAQMNVLFTKNGQKSLTDTIFPIPTFSEAEEKKNKQRLTLTENAQPSIGAFSVGLYNLLEKAGLKANFTAGHSFGELTALWAAGVMNEETYLKLAKARGQAMAAPEDPNFDAGTMLAVKGEVDKIQAAISNIPEITAANLNSKNQVVLAGSKKAIDSAIEQLEAKGFSVIPLPVSAAFHTPLVQHAQKPFAQQVRKAEFKAPSIPVYSNGSGKKHDEDPKAIQQALCDHILNAVRFKDEIESIYEDGGSIFVEIGPKNVLTNLVGNILEGKPHFSIAVNPNPKKDSDQQLREAIIQMRVAGLPLNNFDPYQIFSKTPEETVKSKVNIILNGGLYVSDQTKSAFEKALNDGFKISVAENASTKQKLVLKTHTETPHRKNSDGNGNGNCNGNGHNTNQNKAPFMTTNPAELSKQLSQFQSLQNETVRVHDQYLQNEAEAGRIIADFARMEVGIVSNPDTQTQNHGIKSQVLANLENGLQRIHENQTTTARVHEQYLKNQAEFTQQFTELLKNNILVDTIPSDPQAKIGAEPHSEQSQIGQNGSLDTSQWLREDAASETPVSSNVIIPHVSSLTDTLLTIVSEKTGYPVEMLELEMNLEADLGIDSIKRVEILGAMQNQFSDLPTISAEDLAELHTLSQIIDHIQVQSHEKIGSPTTENDVQQPTAISESIQNNTIVDNSLLKENLLAIVTEKTGYPSEMIELDMDLEADLGIDSIKRVEILGAVQEKHPNLPTISSENLSELKTLNQIISYLNTEKDSGSNTKPTNNVIAIQNQISSVPTEEIKETLLSIVSEKTGYPVEMLDMDMDLEADLGIDSIKRVEILGALQEKFPNLPNIEPDKLSELNTLEKIFMEVNQTSETIGSTMDNPIKNHLETIEITNAESHNSTILSNNTEQDSDDIAQSLLTIVSEKTGYPVEMLEMEMHMEADLGIDSIKRVEILGAMQDQHPDLPGIDPETLGNLTTIGSIIELLDQSKKKPEAVKEINTSRKSESDAGRLIKASPTILKSLPVPDQLEFTLTEDQIALVTDDGSDLTTETINRFIEKKWRVIVLRYPHSIIKEQCKLPECVVAIALDDMSEVEIRSKLTHVQEKHGKIAVFIHLNPAAVPESSEEILKHIFFTAKHLKDQLIGAAENGRSAFMVVTHLDGEFGLTQSANFNPINGGFFGLVKTINLEWPGVFCRALDISDDFNLPESSAYILAELLDPNQHICEIGYSKNGRNTLSIG